MKILIVDDEEMIRGVLKEYVEFEGNEAFEAADGMEAVKMCKDNDYDVVLMDVMMPRLDGFSAVKEIRKFKDVPVIMLSARGEEYDKLFGFEIGADDYVTKPFSPKEVMARINAVTKRRAAGNSENGNEILKFEGLEIDMAGRNVYVDGEKAELTPKEYELLFYLVRNKGIALTREKLLYDVWGFDFTGTTAPWTRISRCSEATSKTIASLSSRCAVLDINSKYKVFGRAKRFGAVPLSFQAG